MTAGRVWPRGPTPWTAFLPPGKQNPEMGSSGPVPGRLVTPERFPPPHGHAGQRWEGALRQGGHGGGNRAAQPLPEGPGRQGEANPGPAGFRRGSRDKNPNPAETGGWREGMGGRKKNAPRKGEGPEQRVRAPSARMQHCDKARPGGEGGKGTREGVGRDQGDPAFPHPSLHVARQRPSPPWAPVSGP